MPVRFAPDLLRLTSAAAVAAETATTPVPAALVKRSILPRESAEFATIAPPWATTRKRPTLVVSRVVALSVPPEPTATTPELSVSAVSKVLTPVSVSVPKPLLMRRPAVFAVLSVPTVTTAPVPPPPVRVTVGTVPAT